MVVRQLDVQCESAAPTTGSAGRQSVQPARRGVAPSGAHGACRACAPENLSGVCRVADGVEGLGGVGAGKREQQARIARVRVE
eukprot:3442299-Prymnesium_polylepis.1